MASSNRTIVGVVLILASAGLLAAGLLTPNPTLVAMSQPYDGKPMGPFRFVVPKTGHYRVGLRMASDAELLKAIEGSDPPIAVSVSSGGNPVGETTFETEVGQDVFWNAYRFSGLTGESADITIQPGISWQKVASRRPTLEIARVPENEEGYFKLTSLLRIGAAALLIVGAVTLLSARRRA